MVSLMKYASNSSRNLEQLFQMYYGVLEKVGETSALGVHLQDTLRKTITISIASHLETIAKITILNLVRNFSASQGQLIENFIYNKILDRGYHTLFDWKVRKATSFYSSFSKEGKVSAFYYDFNEDETSFKDFMKRKENEDEEFRKAVESFLELGELRNKLVHNDLASAQLELDIKEIEQKYKAAQNFFPKFYDYSLEFVQANTEATTA